MKWPLALPVKGLKEARKQTFWPSFTALFRGAWLQTYEAYLVTLLVRNDDTFLIREGRARQPSFERPFDSYPFIEYVRC